MVLAVRGSHNPRPQRFSVYDRQLPDYESPQLRKGPMSVYSLPDLPYGYDALEPYIDARTMELHHTQHHGFYVDKLNAALSATTSLHSASEHPIDDVLWDIGTISEESRNAVRNYGGGHANHSFFWTILSKDGGGKPAGPLAEAITEEFGSFTAFRERFSGVATAHFGSGWAWLVRTRNRLVIYSLPHEDSPLTAEETPILGLDLWEHAYYLQYPAARADYVEAFWNIVNWEEVSRRFEEATRS
jgi:superoxide dismutase, Fe-Mn family